MIVTHAFAMDFILIARSDEMPDVQEISITQITVQIIEFIRYVTVKVEVFQFDETYLV